jgi:predicted metalloprotease with PDZ domain
MSPSDAWEKFNAGFRRGREGAGGMTLAQATENMHRGGHYLRVYWEGTALMLMGDVRLRQLTDNKQSLDSALTALAECCLPSNEPWSARQVLHKLDELTGATVFEDLYEVHVSSKSFPDLSQAYRQLGLVSRENGRMELLPDAPFAALRDAIMGPRAAGPLAVRPR